MNYQIGMGDIAWLSIRCAANLIAGRAESANSSGGCVVVYLDGGELYTAKTGTASAKWAETSSAVDIIGYYNRDSSIADIAEDLADARIRNAAMIRGAA